MQSTIEHLNCTFRRIVVAALVVVAGSASLASAADDKTYAVKLNHPVKVGLQFAITATAELNQSADVVVNGKAQPPRREKFTAELTGTERVDAISDKSGGPTKLTVTIDKLTKDGVEVLPAGTVVLADQTEVKKVFKIDGAAVDPAVADVLTTVIDITRGDCDLSNETMMGTAKRQSVGGTWAGDPVKIAAVLGDELPISAKHIKATSKLVSVKIVDGQQVEVVESTIEADPLEAGKTFHGLMVVGGKFTGTFTQALPMGLSNLPYITSDDHGTMKMRGTTAGGAVAADVTVMLTVHRTMAEKK